MLALLLQCLGFFTACALLRQIAPFVTAKISPKNIRKAGKWAVVTGATDGIGKAYCDALAKNGLNLVMISRTESKLQACAQELEEKYSIESRIVAADFNHASDPGFIAPIAAALQHLDIGMLVNNVGMSYEMPLHFAAEESTDAFLLQLESLNAVSALRMSKLVLPGMVQRKAGFIINISSAAGVMPCASPMLAGYSATKASMAALSKSIHYEVSGSGVVCQVHAPYFVVSKMSKIRKANFWTPTPQEWVASSLQMLGQGGTVLVPYFPHFVQHFVVGLLPEWLSGWYTLRLHKDIQRRAIKKKEREAAKEK